MKDGRYSRGSFSTVVSKLPTHTSILEDAVRKPQERIVTYVRTEIEYNPAIIQFLSSIRKPGMDILFPKSVQDKVCISVLKFHESLY